MLMTNFIGKPYAGKPHVRFDEGVGKVIYPSRSTLPVKGFGLFQQPHYGNNSELIFCESDLHYNKNIYY